MPAVKTYTRVNFQNYPSTSTPLNATNLNKLDKGIDDLDDEVVTVKNAIENMSFDADSISYDNTSSGLQATDVQDAVDEINDNLTASNQTAGVTDVPFRFGCTDDGKFGYIINQGGADSVIPFKSKIKIPNIQLYGSDNGSGTRDAIADTEIDTSKYTKLKIGTLTMVNSSSYQEYIMVLGDGTAIWSKSLDNGSYSANDIVVDISSVNKLKIRLKIANLNANCYVYAQNIEIS